VAQPDLLSADIHDDHIFCGKLQGHTSALPADKKRKQIDSGLGDRAVVGGDIGRVYDDTGSDYRMMGFLRVGS
jgi:hypothetical protein